MHSFIKSSKVLATLFIASLALPQTLAVAVACDKFGFISTDDVRNLVTDADTNSFVDQLADPAVLNEGSAQNFFLGSVQFCVTNPSTGANGAADTSVSLASIGSVANDYLGQCCSPLSGSVCQGGAALVNGNNGISLVMSIRPIGDSCNATIFSPARTGSELGPDIANGHGVAVSCPASNPNCGITATTVASSSDGSGTLQTVIQATETAADDILAFFGAVFQGIASGKKRRSVRQWRA